MYLINKNIVQNGWVRRAQNILETISDQKVLHCNEPSRETTNQSTQTIPLAKYILKIDLPS